MSAAWSDEQQRCLAALGYTLYRTAALPATSGADASAPIDPLLRALLRAANHDHAQGDANDWMRKQRIPTLTQLRGDPVAKRALWPQLRASRRERGQS
jgi:hypothetical protein